MLCSKSKLKGVTTLVKNIKDFNQVLDAIAIVVRSELMQMQIKSTYNFSKSDEAFF